MRSLFCLALFGCLLSPGVAGAWFDNGHMAIARFAWQKLSEPERQRASEILRQHPHYDEFLKAQCPDEVPLDEWAFMRASVWPDFVRDVHSEKYNKPTWHYVDMPYVPPYSKAAPPARDQPKVNVVTQIDWSIAQLQGDELAVKPIALCWLLHLIGDIHQPNHAITLFSEAFPEGDRGGNLALIRIEDGEAVKMHMFWDGQMGQYASWPDIVRLDGAFAEIEKQDASEVRRLLEENATAASWAQESFAAGKKFAYLDGDLRPANVDLHPREDNVPRLSAEYARQASKTAQTRGCLAANRIAMALGKALGSEGK